MAYFKTHLGNLFRLQHFLTARLGGFARQRSYSYAFSQKQPIRTPQKMLRTGKDYHDGF